MKRYVYHVTTKDDWNKALKKGIYEMSTLNKSFDEVGFIHLSFKKQLPQIINTIYKNEKRELIILKIPIKGLSENLKIEKSGNGRYPHYYKKIDINLIEKTSPA